MTPPSTVHTFLGLAMMHRQEGDQATDPDVRRLNDEIANRYVLRAMSHLAVYSAILCYAPWPWNPR